MLFTACRFAAVWLVAASPILAQTPSAADAAPTTRPKPRNVVIKYEPEKEMIYKTIPLGVMEYDEVDRACRPWLSPGGLLIYEEPRASILVYDTPAVISRISELLRAADRESVNIMVTFDYQETSSDDQAVLTAVKPPPGKNNPPGLKAKLSSGKDLHLTSQFIVTRSGFPASIWVGETMVDPSWLRLAKEYPRRTVATQNGQTVNAATMPDGAPLTRVGASLQVRPVFRPDGQIDLELFPEIRYLSGPKRYQTVKVAALTTHLTVQEGAKVLVGGMLDARREQYVNIFGPDFFRRRDIDKICRMYVSAKRAPANSRFFSDAPGAPGAAPARPVRVPNGKPAMFE